jgi:hypothetical protein
MTRTANSIDNTSANLISVNGGMVRIEGGAYRVTMPKAARWIRRGAYRLDGYTITFSPSGRVWAMR